MYALVRQGLPILECQEGRENRKGLGTLDHPAIHRRFPSTGRSSRRPYFTTYITSFTAFTARGMLGSEAECHPEGF